MKIGARLQRASLRIHAVSHTTKRNPLGPPPKPEINSRVSCIKRRVRASQHFRSFWAIADMIDRKKMLYAVNLWQAAVAIGLAVLGEDNARMPFIQHVLKGYRMHVSSVLYQKFDHSSRRARAASDNSLLRSVELRPAAKNTPTMLGNPVRTESKIGLTLVRAAVRKGLPLSNHS
jgi:hypothetical protein